MSKLAFVLVSLLAATTALAGDDTKKKAEEAMPKAPAEIGERVKAMAGTWKCDGKASGMDAKQVAFKGSMTTKADLDGYWVHDSFAGTMGDGKMAMQFKFESYSTYDASSKKWRTLFVDNMGGSMSGMADPMKDGKMESAGEMVGPMGKSQFKDHTDVSDMKKGAHMWGEMSMDTGKTWKPVYDMTCKK